MRLKTGTSSSLSTTSILSDLATELHWLFFCFLHFLLLKKFYEPSWSESLTQTNTGKELDQQTMYEFLNNNDNDNNKTSTMFMVLSSCLKHCESSPWFARWVQHGARWPPTFGPSRSAWTISPPVNCQLTTLTIAILLSLSPKADTHFTIPRKVEGWVDPVGWLHTEMVYPVARGHPSKY